jgi:hypothetical protein
MNNYLISYRDQDRNVTLTEAVRASDLPAAVAGFYAMRGPASGGTLHPIDFVSVELTDDAAT